MTPLEELMAFLHPTDRTTGVKHADNYTQDTRSWPDPTEPRASKPPAPHGCTCPQGRKLECPIHGLHAPEEAMDVDHGWSLPEGNPVGYPSDTPRTWTQVSHVATLASLASPVKRAGSAEEGPLAAHESSEIAPDAFASFGTRAMTDEEGHRALAAFPIDAAIESMPAAFTSREEVVHRPRLAHTLRWRPGTFGRGFILPDGSVHTWPEESGDHDDVARSLGVPWDDVYESAFGINTKGQVYFHRLQDMPNEIAHPMVSEFMDTINQADPRLSPRPIYTTTTAGMETGRVAMRALAGMTVPQRQRFRQQLEATHGPEQTEVLHQFPDGWSIHRLPTWNEVSREGYMMHHCWAGLGEGEHEPVDDDDYMLSLRDPSGWPHMSFNYDPQAKAPYSFGEHGGGAPDDESPHWHYIDQFVQHNGGDWLSPLHQDEDGWYPGERGYNPPQMHDPRSSNLTEFSPRIVTREGQADRKAHKSWPVIVGSESSDVLKQLSGSETRASAGQDWVGSVSVVEDDPAPTLAMTAALAAFAPLELVVFGDPEFAHGQSDAFPVAGNTQPVTFSGARTAASPVVVPSMSFGHEPMPAAQTAMGSMALMTDASEVHQHRLAAWLPDGFEPWQPGKWGKGCLDTRSGEHLMWATHPNTGAPHHADMDDALQWPAYTDRHIVIHPSGYATHAYGQASPGEREDAASFHGRNGIKYVNDENRWQQLCDRWDRRFAKTAAMTRTQLLQMAQQLEQQHGPDTAEVVHQWPDGWTVRKLNTYGDAHREGTLMDNCFRYAPGLYYDEDNIWTSHPQVPDSVPEHGDPEYDAYVMPEWPEYPHGVDMTLPLHKNTYSLRDPDNLPHASFDYHTSGPAALMGRYNSDPKMQYAKRFHEWASAQDDPQLQRWVQTHPLDNSNPWYTAKTAAQHWLKWRPGQYGRGFLFPYAGDHGRQSQAEFIRANTGLTPTWESHLGKTAHQLRFNPGQHAYKNYDRRWVQQSGRGMVMDDGTVHTWPEDKGTHHDMAYKLNQGFQHAFMIRPSGEYFTHDIRYQGTPETHAAIQAADPRLTQIPTPGNVEAFWGRPLAKTAAHSDEGEWRFSWRFPSPTPSPRAPLRREGSEGAHLLEQSLHADNVATGSFEQVAVDGTRAGTVTGQYLWGEPDELTPVPAHRAAGFTPMVSEGEVGEEAHLSSAPHAFAPTVTHPSTMSLDNVNLSLPANAPGQVHGDSDGLDGVPRNPTPAMTAGRALDVDAATGHSSTSAGMLNQRTDSPAQTVGEDKLTEGSMVVDHEASANSDTHHGYDDSNDQHTHSHTTPDQPGTVTHSTDVQSHQSSLACARRLIAMAKGQSRPSWKEFLASAGIRESFDMSVDDFHRGITQTFGPIGASRIGGLYDDVHAYEYYDHLADALGGSWSFGPKRFPYLTTPMGNAKLVAWADPVMDQGRKVRRTTQGPIQLNGLFADAPGSGLGTAIMNASKDFADRTGRPFNVGMVANKRFFNTERFPWMHQPNEWSPDLRYDPQATEFSPKIGSPKSREIWGFRYPQDMGEAPGISPEAWWTGVPLTEWPMPGHDSPHPTGTFSKTALGTMNWTPGSWGKGFILDGNLHTWNTDQSVNSKGQADYYFGAPHHAQAFWDATGINPLESDRNRATFYQRVTNPIVISPEGWYHHNLGRMNITDDVTRFAEAHPALKYVRDPNKWQIRVGAYYHVAPTSVRDEFQTQGPRLADPQANAQWDGFNVNGGDPRFYAWNSLPVAEQYRERLTEHRGQPHDIWEINAPGGWFDEDPEIYYKDAERDFGPGAQSLMYRGDKPLTDYRRVSMGPLFGVTSAEGPMGKTAGMPTQWNMGVVYPTEYHHPYQGIVQAPFNRDEVQKWRTPFWIGQHNQDPNDHQIFLGYPGGEHADSLVDENYDTVASGSIKPASFFGNFGDNTSHFEFYNTWPPFKLPPYNEYDGYDEDYMTPEEQANLKAAGEYTSQLYDTAHRTLQREFPELQWARPVTSNHKASNHKDSAGEDPRYFYHVAPTWGKTASTMNWTPGSWGKGLILDGNLHTWNTDNNVARYGPRMGEPHHGEFLSQHGLAQEDRDRWSDRIIIAPTGHYMVNDPEEFWQTPERFALAHPALKFVRDPYKWEMRVAGAEGGGQNTFGPQMLSAGVQSAPPHYYATFEPKVGTAPTNMGATPSVLWHAAPVQERQQIAQQGLVAGPEWGVVFLAGTPEEAQGYEEDLWAVNPQGLQLTEEGEYWTTPHVPPQNLRLNNEYDSYIHKPEDFTFGSTRGRVGDMSALGASGADPDRIAALKVKYAEVIDQAGHQLWFNDYRKRRNEEPGRGMVHEPTGTVYTWPEWEATHADRINILQEQHPERRPSEYIKFYLRPNGVVTGFNGPFSAMQSIWSADPGLASANGFA